MIEGKKKQRNIFLKFRKGRQGRREGRRKGRERARERARERERRERERERVSACVCFYE